MADDREPTKRVVKKRVVKKASPAPEPTEAGPRRRPHLPSELPDVPPRVALAISGAVVGLVAVGLTALLMVVFDLVRGTSTGSGVWGFLGLVVVIALSVGTGSFLLGSLHVPHARLTALVGALLVLIAVLAALLDVVFSGWMWLVVPVLSAFAYLATHWVLSRTEA